MPRTVHHHHHHRFGIGLGTLIACVLSWSANHSLLWLIVHGLFGWLYVIYYALGFGH